MVTFLAWLERWKALITVVLVIGLFVATGAYAVHSSQLRSLLVRATETNEDETLQQLAAKQQALMAQLASIELNQPAGLPAEDDSITADQASGISSSSSQSDVSSLSTTSGLVHLNSADEAVLETLPDIGPSKAQAILEYRTAHGRFNSIDELDNVKGIGAATLVKLKPYLTLD